MMRLVAAYGLVVAANATPEQTIVFKHEVQVSTDFASRVMQEPDVRSGVASAGASSFFQKSGMRATVTVEGVGAHRSLQDTGDFAGLTVMYSVHCGSLCPEVGNHLAALADNEACGCGEGNYGPCFDDSGAACALTPHAPGEDWTTGSCVSATGGCVYTSGQGTLHAEALIAAINDLAIEDFGFDPNSAVVQSTADEVAASVSVPSAIYIPSFVIPPTQDCVGSWSTCTADCTNTYSVEVTASVAYTDQYGGIQPPGAACEAEDGAVSECVGGQCSSGGPSVCTDGEHADEATLGGPSEWVYVDALGDSLGPCSAWEGYCVDMESYGLTDEQLSTIYEQCQATCNQC